MLSTFRARPIVAAFGLAALLAAPLAAQEMPTTGEFQSWRLPGWTFTPGVILGGLFDSNVAVAYPPADTHKTASDTLFQLQPFGQLEYFSPRTTFSSGYQGSMRHYLDFNDLDGTDHRAYLSLRRLVTRRVTVFLDDNFLSVPTTDQLLLNDVPFLRTGSRYNAFAGGVEARLTRSLDFNTRYDMTWVDFERKDTLLTGGVVNGVRSSLSRRLGARSSFGGEYGVRFADLNSGLKNQTFQEVGGIYRYRTGPLTTFELAGGFAHLLDRTRDISRNGPYVRAALTRHAVRATLGLSYERSFMPSVSFGGSNESQELRGFVQMPLSRNRFYVNESAAWRRTDPFVESELPLDSMWFRTVGGYAVQRWLRLEAYHQFTRQDTRIAAGQINRHIIGGQLVLADPMRIR
jgi:hypothetical protein